MYRVFVVWRRGSRFRHNIEHRSVLKELLPPTGNRGLLERLILPLQNKDKEQ